MNEVNGEAGLNISAVRNSDSMATITVRLGADVLFVDKLDVSKHKSRLEFIERLCEGRDGINRVDVEQMLLELAARQAEEREVNPQTGPSREELLDAMPPLARQQARQALDDPRLIGRILDDISVMGVAGEKELSLMIYMIGVSRQLRRPLAGIVQGPSSSGKSYTIECVASLFPAEAIVQATQMTPQALFYMPPGRLAHQFVVAGERSRAKDDETAEATRALREMLSSGRLSKLVPMKLNGTIQTVLIEQGGPISFVESTTLTNIFDEDLNRCVLLTTDERRQHTRKVIDSIATKFSSNGAAGRRESVIQRHNAIQRMIEPHTVLVPFAPVLGEHFPDDRVEARRAFPQVLSLIQTSALLHQYQRQRDQDGHVLADANDYEIARRLLSGPLARQLGGALSDPAKRFLQQLCPHFGRDSFTTQDASKHVKGGRSSIYGWLNELAEYGLAKVVEAHKGPRPAVWQLIGTPEDVEDTAVLPSASVLFPEIGQTHGHNN